MRLRLLLFVVVGVIFVVQACSGEGMNTVVPQSANEQENLAAEGGNEEPMVASDVLYERTSDGTIGYKAFGAFEVRFDPKTMNAEITPSRKAKAIGQTFDADLTQFLTVSPCADCLKINGIRYTGGNQFEIGFAIRHPFKDITKRPDLHAFDVRGIVIANGNYNFPLTKVATGETTEIPARANVSLVANADGWTHHFVQLASDPNYFDPPKTFNVNINPYKRYFENASTPVFDPNNPAGYNVMKVGSDWETQKYLFSLPTTVDPIDFVFVLDCAYGQSATFQNRKNPYYFLPEFNRKEAWKVDVVPISGNFVSHDTSSSVTYRVEVCDWQSGAAPDPGYPNTSNLGGIKEKSDVKSVSIEIPAVSGLVETTSRISGSGTYADPYVYQLTVTNSQNAGAGWFYGIVAVRDDLHKKQGPIAIPATPAGFPYPGPEIYDYSTYQIFKVRVKGSVPQISGFSYVSNVEEGDVVDIVVNVSDPDGDTMTYHWEQVDPITPEGTFSNTEIKDTKWQAPPLFDVPVTGLSFTLKITVSDIDGSTKGYVYINVNEKNTAPVCVGITTNPYWSIIDKWQPIQFFAEGYDYEGDMLKYEWDYNWDGDISNFDVDAEGKSPPPHTYWIAGFYTVGCRISESNRVNYLSSYCTKLVMVQGVKEPEFKVDNSDLDDPKYREHDIQSDILPTFNRTYHVTYCVLDGSPVMYCNTNLNPYEFGSHQEVTAGSATVSCHSPKITTHQKYVHVAWVEADTSSSPFVYKIKINSSDDYGSSFGALGGERTIDQLVEPNFFSRIDISYSKDGDYLYLACSLRTAGNYACKIYISDNNGVTWSTPAGTGFRDVVNTTIATLYEVEVSGDGYVHALWLDSRTGTKQFFYDISTNRGNTWGTDYQISDATSSTDCGMDVDNLNDAHFAWYGSDKRLYYRKATYGSPPSLSPNTLIIDLSAATFLYGVDIEVSPLADIIVVPVMYLYSGNYQTTYFYSNDYPVEFDRWFIQGYGTNHTEDISCDGFFYNFPGRLEVCSIWVDSRTSLAPFNDHIWGEFSYYVDRP